MNEEQRRELILHAVKNVVEKQIEINHAIDMLITEVLREYKDESSEPSTD